MPQHAWHWMNVACDAHFAPKLEFAVSESLEHATMLTMAVTKRRENPMANARVATRDAMISHLIGRSLHDIGIRADGTGDPDEPPCSSDHPETTHIGSLV